MALARADFGDPAAAQRTFNKLIPQAKSQPPSMESAMVLRDGAKLKRSGRSNAGAGNLQRRHGRVRIVARTPSAGSTLTRLTRNDEKDDWLKRGMRQRCGGPLSPAGILTSPLSTITGVGAAPVVTPI
ncbi:hypothetical protein ACNKHU_21955 [Shigella flexneri]